MALSDLVNVTITAQTASPTRPGFGTPLVLAYHTLDAVNRVRTYNRAADLVSDLEDGGMSASDAAAHPAVLALQAIFAQNPTVRSAKVGRRSSAWTHTVTLKCLSAVEGTVYSIDVNGTTVTYTVPASATTTSVATAIELLVEAVTGVDASAATDTITCTASTAGKLITFANWDRRLIRLTDTTADVSSAADLNAILQEDGDWYGLCLDCNSEAIINAVAAWTESNKKILAANSSDGAILDSASTTDVAQDLETAGYARTYLQFCGKSTSSFAGAAILGNRLQSTPGSDTWKFKTLAGVPVDTLSATERTNALAKKCNVYVQNAGISMTEEGFSSSGEFVDNTRFIDWLTAQIQINVFGRLVNNPKIPFTDAGVAVIQAQIEAALQSGVDAGGLAASPKFVVNVPKVADINPVDKAARRLTGITFEATLAGAIHSVTITGNVVV